MFRKLSLVALLLMLGAGTGYSADLKPTAPDAETQTSASDEEHTLTVAAPEPTELTSDSDDGLTFTKERVLNLPQDQNKFFITVFGSPNDPKFGEIKTWFRDVPDLARLKSQTHFNVVTSDSPDYRNKYAKGISTLPMVRVQTAKGGTVYQVSGNAVPMSGQALSKAVNTECLFRWRQRHQQNNGNGNGNRNGDRNVDQAAPDEDENDLGEEGDEHPDTQPDNALPDDQVILIGGLLGILLVGGFTFVSNFQSRSRYRLK